MTKAGVLYFLDQQDISGGVTSEWMDVKYSNYHSWAYKTGSGGNVTITMEFGAVLDGVVTKIGETSLVSSGTGTSYDVQGVSIPLCQYVRFVFSGTDTSTSFVFLGG